MPLKVTCRCGNAMKIGDNKRGMAIQCPECENTIQIPAQRLDEMRADKEEAQAASPNQATE